jgi:flagellar motor switch protein FliG
MLALTPGWSRRSSRSSAGSRVRSCPELIARIARLEELPAESLAVASEALSLALAASGAAGESRGGQEFDGVGFAAALLNELPIDDSDRLLERIAESEAGVAPMIREAMFTFEDLSRLDRRSMQTLMREIAADQLVVALRTASDELRDAFYSAMSQRAVATIREDLELLPPKRLSEVEAAQREIVETAMRLASDRQLVLPAAVAEEMV